MRKVMSLNLALVLIIGLQAVDAEYNECISIFVGKAQGDLHCDSDSIELYVRCVLKERGLTTTRATDAQLTMIKTQLDSNIARFGLSCNFDLKSLVQQIQEKNILVRKVRSGSATDYNSATTTNECLNVYTSHKSLSCSELTPYIKCLFRVFGITKYISEIPDSLIQNLQTQLNNNLSQLGLHCNVNVKSVLDELEHNNSYRPFHLFSLITLTAIAVIFL